MEKDNRPRRYNTNNVFCTVTKEELAEMRAISDNYSAEDIVYKSISSGIDVMIVSHSHSLQEAFGHPDKGGGV